MRGLVLYCIALHSIHYIESWGDGITHILDTRVDNGEKITL